jgi:hypothetical protein
MQRFELFKKTETFKSIFIIAMILMAVFAFGCLSSDDDTETTESATTITISGTSDDTSMTSALIYETEEDKQYIESLTDGAFEISVDAGTYSIILLDENNVPQGIVDQDGVKIFTLDDDTRLGTLTFNSSTYTISTDTILTASAKSLANQLKALTTDAEDTEAVNLMVESTGQATEGADDDDEITVDGYPDGTVVDADENGSSDNNERPIPCKWRLASDGTTTDPTFAEEVEILKDSLDALICHFFDNLKLPHEQLFKSVDLDVFPWTDQDLVTVEVLPDAVLEPLIYEIRGNIVPLWAANAEIAQDAAGFTLSSYPTVGDPWTIHNRVFGRGVNPGGDALHTIWFKTPGQDPIQGSIITMEMELLSGSIYELAAKNYFVPRTLPKVNTITDADVGTPYSVVYPVDLADPTHLGTSTNPFLVSATITADVTFEVSRPITQKLGYNVCGQQWNGHIFYYDSSGNLLDLVDYFSPNVTDTDTCHPSSMADMALTFDRINDMPLNFTDSSGVVTAIDSYQVDITASSLNGDNAAAILYFQNH